MKHVEINCTLHNSASELCEMRKSCLFTDLEIPAKLIGFQALYTLKYRSWFVLSSIPVAEHLT